MKEVIIPDTKYIRDIHSKAILNTDKNALNEYLIKKELVKKELKEKEEYNLRLSKLESDMQRIKNLLIDIKSGLNFNAN